MIFVAIYQVIVIICVQIGTGSYSLAFAAGFLTSMVGFYLAQIEKRLQEISNKLKK